MDDFDRLDQAQQQEWQQKPEGSSVYFPPDWDKRNASQKLEWFCKNQKISLRIGETRQSMPDGSEVIRRVVVAE